MSSPVIPSVSSRTSSRCFPSEAIYIFHDFNHLLQECELANMLALLHKEVAYFLRTLSRYQGIARSALMASD